MDQKYSYQLLELIGQGATSDVHLAVLDNQRCALKVFNEQTTSEVVERELQILKTLSHKNIARLIASSEDTESPRWIAAELCHPNDLFNYILEGEGFQLPQARFLIKQLIEGLEYLHLQGYVHRDIKLENIVFSLDGFRPVLTDFGFSVKLSDHECAKRRDGTLGFMAPELLTNEQVIMTDQLIATDMFSLGVVIFAIACGSMPFHYEPNETSFTLKLDNEQSWKRFWSYQTIKHNGKFRTMIEGLLTFIPENRWTLEELKNCQWLNDKTSTEKQFIQTMLSRSSKMKKF